MKKLGTVMMTLFVSVLTLGILLPVINKNTGGKVEEQFDKWLNAIPEKTDKPSEPVPDTRENLVTINLRNDIDNGTLIDGSFINFIINGASRNVFYEDIIYTIDGRYDLYECGKLSKDGGGLKLGTSNVYGYFLIQFNNYKFNRVKIVGKNYTSYSTSTKKYSSDAATIYVNEMNKSKTFATNAEDKTKDSPIEECVFEFSTNYNFLNVSSELGRSVIFQIELWTEGVGTELQYPSAPSKDSTDLADFIKIEDVVDPVGKKLVISDDLGWIGEKTEVLSIAFRDPENKFFDRDKTMTINGAFDYGKKNLVSDEKKHFNGWTIFTFKNPEEGKLGFFYPIEINDFYQNLFWDDMYSSGAIDGNVYIYDSNTILPSEYIKRLSTPITV